MNQDVGNLWPLRTCAKKIGVSERQLAEWERRREKNGFPEPAKRIGRYKLFDVDEVERWHILYSRATQNVGRGRELNAEGKSKSGRVDKGS